MGGAIESGRVGPFIESRLGDWGASPLLDLDHLRCYVGVTLGNRGIIITGASLGLGKAIASACIREGAHVLLCARDQRALEQAQEELGSALDGKQRVVTHAADVSQLGHVDSLFERARKELPNLDGLVNNAGILGPRGLLENTDPDEWWRTLEINLRGTVNMCRRAVPIFRKQRRGKIVNLSGGGATSPMPHFTAYAASKSAVVRFTETLAVETSGSGIDINAVAPGALNTRMLDEVLDSGPERVGTDYYKRSVEQKEQGGASIENAAALCTYLLSADSDGISGLLISAVWDAWKDLAKYKEQLGKTDVYRLRRIVPSDRNVSFE